MDDLPVCRICKAFTADLFTHLQWHVKNEGSLVINWGYCPLCGDDTYTLWPDSIDFTCGHTFKEGALGYGRYGTAKVG